MSEENKNYRPRSPDLSSYVPPPSLGRLPSYSRTPSESFPYTPHVSVDTSSAAVQQTPTAPSYFGGQHQVQSPATFAPQFARVPSIPGYPTPGYQAGFNPYQANIQARGPPPFETPSYSQPGYYDDPNMARTRAQRSAEQYDPAYDPGIPPPMHSIPPPAANEFKPDPEPTVDPALLLDVKTKFPVARIKRIMQADEDIGKVAQATPTAAAKALELFMTSLVIKASGAARNANSKRITAQHLKSAIQGDKNFDFLLDTCADVPDEDRGGKKGRGKSEEASDDEGAKKRPKKRRGSEDSD